MFSCLLGHCDALSPTLPGRQPFLLRDTGKHLDQNAVEGSTFELKHDPYFVATVDVIDGEKVMSFIPDGAVKRLIKDDDSSSENATE